MEKRRKSETRSESMKGNTNRALDPDNVKSSYLMVRVSSDQKKLYKKVAKEKNMSISSYILTLIEKDLA